MSRQLQCDRGHRWEAVGAAAVCPTCGAAAKSDTPPVIPPTVQLPPDSRPPSGTQETLWKAMGHEPVNFDSDPELHVAPAPATTEIDVSSKLDALAAAATAFRPTVPNYEILDELGRGGMGVVYKARHLRLKRMVALKMILSGPHAGSEELERFVTEAEAAARLQHPHIVQIYEIGEHEGRPYFSLEYVEGGSLDGRLEGKPLPPRPAARLVEALARAMHYAHERGIVHRDLKPANVLLAESRESPLNSKPAGGNPKAAWLSQVMPKITDFGLAKKLDADGGQTRTGSILGTPNYMSPEQATGQVHAVGPGSDIYALGAILYELLTGRPPFTGESAFDTLRRVASAEPLSPRSLVAGMPRDIETICLKCLHKDPRRRYADALELARDLRRFQDGETIRARPTPSWERAAKWARRRPGAAALVVAGIVTLAVALSAGCAYHAWLLAEKDREAARSAELQTALDQSRQRMVRLLVANGTRLMDDGDLIGGLPWFAEAMRLEQDIPRRQAMHRLRLAAVLEQCPQLSQVWFHRARVNAVVFSPDGRQLASISDDGTTQLWDTATGLAAPRTPRHDKPVLHAAFSPDGTYLATASADGTARLWRCGNGVSFGGPLKHPAAVVAVAFSPDGKYLVTACQDGIARLWLVASQEPLSQQLAHEAALTQAAFSPDGTRVLTAAEDGSVQLWSAETGLPLARPHRQRGSVVAVAFSPDGQLFATACSDGIARVWHSDTGLPATPPLRHAGGVLSVSFSLDGRLLATAGADAKARVWNATTGRALGVPLRHGSRVFAAVFGPSGRRLITASDDNTARVWDALTGEPLSPPLRHNGSVTCAAFSPDGRWAASAGLDGMVRLWSATAARRHVPMFRHQGRVTQALFSPDGRLVATAGEDRTARVWDRETGDQRTLLRHPDAVNRIAFSPDGRLLLTAGRDGAARLWDVDKGELVGQPFPHGQSIEDVAFRPDGARFVTASEDGTARIWNTSGRPRPLRTLQHNGPVLSASYSPDGSQVLTAGADGAARLWDAETGGMLREFKHAGAVHHAAFSPDGKFIATASADRTARVWNAATGEPITPPLRHGSPIVHAAFSPDGLRLVTAGDDNTARVWSARTGEALTPPLLHMGTVRRAVFSPGGDLIATASEDGTARVWDAATGEPITPPLKHHGPATDISFAPDGATLITSGPHAARLWPLARDDRPLDELQRAVKVLAGGRIDETGGLVALDAETVRSAWREKRRAPAVDPEKSHADALAWHTRELEECEMSGDWHAAVWHLDRLLAARPRDASLLRQRGDARAGLGNWRRAVEDFTRAIDNAPDDWDAHLRRGVAHAQSRQWRLAAADFAKNHDLGPDDPRVWHDYALANLAAEDMATYRATCADLLKRFGSAVDVATARQVVWTAVLSPQAVPDPKRLATEAERTLQARPKSSVYLLTLGAAFVRAGRASEAIPKLEAALPDSGDRAAHVFLFLTLAYQQLGKLDEARQWLDRATETLDEAATEQEAPQAWDRRLELELLRLEAERVFKQGKP